MKIRLEKNVPGVGRVGEIVEVKDAYARNYLLPNMMAKVATAATLQVASAQADRQRRQAERTAADLVQARAALMNAKVTVKAESSPKGRLFAAIRSEYLLAQIEQQCQVRLAGVKCTPDQWKSIGPQTVRLDWPDGQQSYFTFSIIHG